MSCILRSVVSFQLVLKLALALHCCQTKAPECEHFSYNKFPVQIYCDIHAKFSSGRDETD
jgi:hypothetical protein